MLAGVIVADAYSDPRVSENNFEISSCVVCPSGCSDYWNNAMQAAVQLNRLEDFIYGLIDATVFLSQRSSSEHVCCFPAVCFSWSFGALTHWHFPFLAIFFPHRSSWGLSALHGGTLRVVAEEKRAALLVHIPRARLPSCFGLSDDFAPTAPFLCKVRISQSN